MSVSTLPTLSYVLTGHDLASSFMRMWKKHPLMFADSQDSLFQNGNEILLGLEVVDGSRKSG